MWGRLVLVGGCKDERVGLLREVFLKSGKWPGAVGRHPIQIAAIRARRHVLCLCGARVPSPHYAVSFGLPYIAILPCA